MPVNVDLRANALKLKDLRLKMVSFGAIVLRVATFGDNIRHLRERAGMKPADLARALQVKPSVVSRWEHNKGGLPETPTLFRLAKALDCTVEQLLAGVNDEYDEAKHRRSALIQAKLLELRSLLPAVSADGEPEYLIENMAPDRIRHLVQLVSELDFELMTTYHTVPEGMTSKDLTAEMIEAYEALGSSLKKIVGARRS